MKIIDNSFTSEDKSESEVSKSRLEVEDSIMEMDSYEAISTFKKYYQIFKI